MNSPRFRPLIKSLVMVSVTLVLIVGTMLAGEYYLRANDARRFARPTTIPGLKYELVPSYRGVYKGIEYRTNEYGFRGPEIAMAKPKGEFRILFLGDSIVQGGLVNEDQAVGARLQTLWQAQAGHEKTLVINGGVSSYDANDYLALYKNKGYKFDPDFVVVGLFLNDNFRYIAREKFAAVAHAPHWWERSVLLRTIVNTASEPQARSFDPPTVENHQLMSQIAQAIPEPSSVEALVKFFQQHNYPLDPITNESLPFVFDMNAWAQVRAPVSELAELVRAHHARLLFIILPVEFQLVEGYSYPQPQQFVMEMCSSLGIDVIDAAPILRKLQADSGRSVYHQRGDMIHFDASAHAAIAQAAFTRMQQVPATIPSTR